MKKKQQQQEKEITFRF